MTDANSLAIVDAQAFNNRLYEIVGRVVSDCAQRPSENVVSLVNASLRAEYAALENEGKCVVTFPGCRIVGSVALMPPGTSELYIVAATEFFPQARHLHDDRDALGLGFFEEYDLYVQSQVGLPPTLLARYGDQPSEYSSFNPSFTKLLDIGAESRPVFAEALARARALSFMR